MKKFNLVFVIFVLVVSGFAYAMTDINGDGIINSFDKNNIISAPLNPSFSGDGGNILVDEGHGEYMTKASCASLFNYLASQGFSATSFSGTITSSVLSGYDALCIGTPRANQGASFSTSEVSAIVSFVQGGGGLMISGDYYNSPYNDNVKANSVATNFGITYKQDSGSPVWPVITDFTSHEINNGISQVGYYGWCTSSIGSGASYIAYLLGTGMAEVNTSGQGKIFSLHDWNLYSDSYAGNYNNLQWVAQGIMWVAEQGIDVTIDATVLTPVVKKPGTFKVKLTVTNNESQSVTCAVFTRVQLPNGSWYPSSGWLFGPFNVTIPANSSKSGTLSHKVPSIAPVGNYVYEANVGVLPEIYDTATASFSVQ